MEIVIGIVGIVLILYPMWKITVRSGLNPLWTLICLIPLGLVVLLWIVAMRPWPGERA